MALSRRTTGILGCVVAALLIANVAAEGNAARRILADAMIAPAPAPAVTSASGMAAVVDTAHQTGIASADGMASVAATVTKAMANSVNGPIILMHGAIQGGEVWEFPRLPEAPGGVKGLLEAAGYTVYNPTLPYHFPNDTWNINDGLVTIQQYVDVYKGVINSNDLHNVYLVGHSLAGVWMQQLLQQIGDRLGGLVFVDAVALETGESFFTNGVAGIVPEYSDPPNSAFFTLIYSYPMFYQELSNEVFRDLFINTRKNDAAFVEETYKLLVPEPHGPELQKVNATTFYTIPMPKAFINMNHDITLLDYRTWLLFSDRVSRSDNAGVPYQVYTIYGDHESMLTQQANLATAILEAVAGLQG